VFTKRNPVHETKKEGRGTKHTVTDSNDDDPRTGGWRFFLWWMLAFLGFPIGGLLAFVLVGSVEGVVSGALGGALAGAVIGAAQWLVIRRYPRVRVGPEWILATALGVAIGDAIGALLTGARTGVGALLITGLATGVAVGLLQWGGFLEGPGLAREPVGAGRRDRLAGWVDGDVGVWHRRRARLLRLRCVGCAGLRGDHRPCDATDAPWPYPLASASP
jgi:hypothetical protein